MNYVPANLNQQQTPVSVRIGNEKSACRTRLSDYELVGNNSRKPTELELADLTSFGVTGTKLYKRAGLSVEQGGSNFDLGLLANSA